MRVGSAGEGPARFLLLALGIVLLAAVLRFETYQKRPLWEDEAWTYKLSQEVRVANFFSLAREDHAEHPTLHPLMISWIADWTDPVIAVRLPSVLFGLVTVALLMGLGNALFDRRTGLVVGVLMTLSIYHVNYSQDGRAYSFILALTIGQVWSLLAWWRTRELVRLLPFPLLATCSVYAHHAGVIAQAGIALACAGLVAVELLRGNAGTVREVARRSLPLVAVWVVTGILYLPQLLNTLHFVGDVQSGVEFTLDPSLRLLHAIFGRWGNGPGWIAIVYEALFLVGVFSIGRRGECAAVLLPWLVTPFAIFALVPFYHGFDLRYCMTALPAFFLIIARGIVWLADFVAARATGAGLAPGVRGRVSAVVMCGVLLLLTAKSAASYRRFRELPRRCSEFAQMKSVLNFERGYCRRVLLLNSLIPGHRWILSVRPES